MKVQVLKHTGEDTGRKVDLPQEIFQVEPNDHAIYLDVKSYLANQRQGTHKTKERSDVAGSTKKIKKQKGTGTARFGDIKNPLFRGGGTVFGPRPRTYGFKINKKTRALARKSALTHKAKEKNITILEDFSFEAPKTKSYQKMLTDLSVNTIKTLVVLAEVDKNVVLSGRNLQKTKVMTAANLNTYEILNADKLIISEGSIEKLKEVLNK